MTRKEVIIGQGRLDVIRTYLADKVPQGARSRGEWARCMAILSAQRKEAPEAQSATRDCPHCWNCDKALLCARCGEAVEAECREEQEAAERAKYPAQRKEAPQPDDAAGKCGGCDLRGNCDEDTLPGGCPKYVAKKWQGVKAQSILLCVNCVKKGLCTVNCGSPIACDLYVPDAAQTLTTNATPPPQYDPATVAFRGYVTRETHERELNEVIDSLSARMDTLVTQGELLAQVGLLRGLVDATGKNHYYHHHENGGIAALSDDVDLLRAAQLGEAEATKKALDALTQRLENWERRVWDTEQKMSQMDDDHVALLKCYTYHLRDHMPEILRDAGEPAVVDDGKEGYVTKAELARERQDRMEWTRERITEAFVQHGYGIHKDEKNEREWSENIQAVVEKALKPVYNELANLARHDSRHTEEMMEHITNRHGISNALTAGTIFVDAAVKKAVQEHEGKRHPTQRRKKDASCDTCLGRLVSDGMVIVCDMRCESHGIASAPGSYKKAMGILADIRAENEACTECAEADCKHEAKPEPCADFRYKHPR
jgi:hypothetical protein